MHFPLRTERLQVAAAAQVIKSLTVEEVAPLQVFVYRCEFRGRGHVGAGMFGVLQQNSPPSKAVWGKENDMFVFMGSKLEKFPELVPF